MDLHPQKLGVAVITGIGVAGAALLIILLSVMAIICCQKKAPKRSTNLPGSNYIFIKILEVCT